ncbi:unnamed protein product [Rotaria sordida]|uniref:Iodothyronine deiodinase n=1 Tax=Rotaria sordida TaxID=392033 RepID=A0A818KV77_9BILA|nr:unnamed protein product [Rotaria sordida]
MDVNKTSSTDSLEKLYAEIAQKTAAAITAEGRPLSGNNGLSIQRSLPQLPRYQPPPPPSPPMERYMVCRMFFPTSGHMGFDTIKLSDELPPIEIVREMILYETYLRLSDSIQKIMDEYHTDECAVTYIHNLIQQHVVEYFGYRDVNALRTALYRFPDDPIVQAAFYVKYNKISQGVVQQGQCTRDRACSLTCAEWYTSYCNYIAEAHSQDEWPVGQTISCVDQPKTFEQRLENARRFKKDFNFEMPMFVDDINNTFLNTYGSWPFRFFVIYEGKLILKAEPDKETFTYDMNEIDKWITNFYQSHTQTI